MKTSKYPPLQSLHTLSSRDKTSLIQTIADEMAATFISISKEVQRGSLSSHHTAPLHQVIRTIQQNTGSTQRRLERKLERYQRRARRWRGERRWIRHQFAEVVRRSAQVHQLWKTRVKLERERILSG